MSDKSVALKAMRDSIQSLNAAVNVVNDGEWFPRQSVAVRNTLVAGAIQSFEFVYEISMKMIRRQIELEQDSPVDADLDNFRDVLRFAAEKGWVADVSAWFGYRKMRNITAHTYDPGKALEVYQGIVSFIADAEALLVALEARNG